MYSTFSISKNTTNNHHHHPPKKDNTINIDTPSTTPSPHTETKRHHVPIACTSCRKNRTKCDNARPCRNCKNKNIDCISTGTSADTRTLTRHIQRLVGRVEHLENRLQEATTATVLETLADDQSVQSMSIKNEPATPTFSSTGSFAAKLNAKLFGHFPRILATDLEETYSSGQTRDYSNLPRFSGPVELSRAQQDYYIRLFLRMIHRTMPVLDQDDFWAYYSLLWESSTVEGVRLGSCLVDIVLALSLQLEINSKPREALECGQDPVASVSYTFYRRCWTELAHEYEVPSLGTLQCLVLTAIYLRNSGKQNTSYLILGLALRVANILGFDQEPDVDMPEKEQRLRERLWEMLFCLDTQQFLEFGRPFSIHEISPRRNSENTSPRQQSDSGLKTEQDLGFFPYYVRLMKIAKTIHTSHENHKDELPTRSESRPKIFQKMEGLTTWAEHVPARLQLRRRRGEKPFTTDTSLDIDADVSVWLLRKCLLLELSFHWIKLGLLRPFIDLDSRPATDVSASSPHSQDALKHALAITAIVNQAVLQTDAIHGWYESHFIQWDATLSIIGFILSQPTDPLSKEAYSMLKICSSIFDTLGTRFTHAAAELVKDMTASLDRVLTGHDVKKCSETLYPPSLGSGSQIEEFMNKSQQTTQIWLDDCSGSLEMLADVSAMEFSTVAPEQLNLQDHDRQGLWSDSF